MPTLIELKAKLNRERVREESRKDIKAIGREREMIKRELRGIRFRKLTTTARAFGRGAGVAARVTGKGIKFIGRFSRNLAEADRQRRIQARPPVRPRKKSKARIQRRARRRGIF